ncbi:hypothetical protein JXA80_05385, partial [bacterium]|nr:hypothetical protein [candidate division CSSED10-310 bacterium]
MAVFKTGGRFVLLMAVALLSPQIFADDFYVNYSTGSNETGDGSEQAPWKTLQFAFDSIEGTEANPHTIHLSAGFYDFPYSYKNGINPDGYENVTGAGIALTKIYYFRFVDIPKCQISNLETTGFGVSDCQEIVVKNCLIGHTMNSFDSSIVYENCIFYKIDDVFETVENSSITINNSILSKCNTVKDDPVPDIVVQYSLVEHGWPGTGNIAGDPQFIDADGFD